MSVVCFNYFNFQVDLNLLQNHPVFRKATKLNHGSTREGRGQYMCILLEHPITILLN